MSQSPDGLPPPDLEPFIGPPELPGSAGEFDPSLGQIAGLPGSEGLEGDIPGDLASLGEFPGATSSLGEGGEDPTGAASEGAGGSSEGGSGDGSGTGGNGSSAIQLENGLQIDLDQGGISGVSLGVKGPVQLTDQAVFQLTGASGISKLRLVTGEIYTGNSWCWQSAKVGHSRKGEIR